MGSKSLMKLARELKKSASVVVDDLPFADDWDDEETVDVPDHSEEKQAVVDKLQKVFPDLSIDQIVSVLEDVRSVTERDGVKSVAQTAKGRKMEKLASFLGKPASNRQ